MRCQSARTLIPLADNAPFLASVPGAKGAGTGASSFSSDTPYERLSPALDSRPSLTCLSPA